MARLTLIPLITSAALTSAVDSAVAAADLSGNSSITSLQSAVSAVESDVSTLQSDVSSVQSDVSSVQSDVSAVTTQVKTNGGYSLSYGPTAQSTGNGAVQYANLNLAAGFTPVANHTYRIGATMKVVKSATRSHIATVVAEGCEARYIVDWDTSLSYNPGDIVLFASSGNKHAFMCTQAADNTIADPETATTFWNDLGDQQLVGSSAWIAELPGTVRAVVEDDYDSYFATTDTTPADGVADALPFIDLSTAIRVGLAPDTAAEVTLAVDGSIVDLGVNH